MGYILEQNTNIFTEKILNTYTIFRLLIIGVADSLVLNTAALTITCT